MSNWLRRWSKRQGELSRGVDSDLVQENRARWIRGLAMLASAYFCRWLQGYAHLSGILNVTVITIGIGSLVGGFILLLWARQQHVFLNKPEPEKPLALFKDE
jgi:hypothetical protein